MKKAFLAAGCAAALLFSPLLSATTSEDEKGDEQRHAQPALGITAEFGRWTDTVRLVYDPDDAPARFADEDYMVSLLQEAIDQWRMVSGIDVVITGVDSTVEDDQDAGFGAMDGLVRVSWVAGSELGGAVGQAGPLFFFVEDSLTALGHYEYSDGTVELSREDEDWPNEQTMMVTLVHELGHLFGLGHSNHPNSVMFANPYNNLSYPRADDIRAMQALYGLPATALSSNTPVKEWLYSPPPTASVAYLNGTDDITFVLEDSTEITQIDDTQTQDQSVFFSLDLIDNTASSEPLEVPLILVVTDPTGYAAAASDWTIECPASASCSAGLSIATLAQLKGLPGIWRVYLVDASLGTAGAAIAELSLPVLTEQRYNLPPAATLNVEPGASPTEARFTLSAVDPDGDNITVRWHAPGGDGNRPVASLTSDDTDVRTLDFPATGVNTFFIELVDDGERYNNTIAGSGAQGDGFQTLLQVEISLPVVNGNLDMQVISSALVSESPVDPAILESVAVNQAAKVTASNGTATSAVFRMGASLDNGQSTANEFSHGDEVVIAGSIIPQAQDIGKSSVEIFVVIRSVVAGLDMWTYRDLDGTFRPWEYPNLNTLQPAYLVDDLSELESFEIYKGSLAPASHRVFIGYRVPGVKYLYYTKTPETINVGN